MIVNLIKNYYDLYIVKFIVTNLTLFNKKKFNNHRTRAENLFRLKGLF